MVRSKAPSKKQKSRGVDFKKFKRKVGRKLPPPKNATNTEIKSKAIILPEQSVASDKVGLAVSKKGLTLKELLQQTSHHNVKVRKDALLGIRELLLKFPMELKLHKLAIIEKLRERINDDDKVVRETLYQLFKSVVLPGCKEDNQGAFTSLVMAYIFNAMTHLSIDVRLMAFKFFDIVVQNYPPSFFLYAEKVLENYIDILEKNQFHLKDKNKLKTTLSGLLHCLSLLPSIEKEVDSFKQDRVEKPLLHAFDTDEHKNSTGKIPIAVKLKDLVPVLVNCFDGLISMSHSQSMLDSQSFECMLSVLKSIDLFYQYYVYAIGKCREELLTSTESCILGVCEQNEYYPLLLDTLFSGFPVQPMHQLSEKDDSRYFILNAVISKIFFTNSQWISTATGLLNGFLTFLIDALFKVYNSELSDKSFYEKHLLSLVPFIPKLVSTVHWNWKRPLLQALTLAFGHCNPDSAMKMTCLKAVEEMLLSQVLYTDEGEEVFDYQRAWLNEIVLLLNSLGSRHPSYSCEVLHLLLRFGQIGISNGNLAEEYDNIQDQLLKFYCVSADNGDICFGPFIELPLECQEISICCLYYFSSLKPQMLSSLALCCLSHSLEPFVLFRIMEILHSSYKAGRIQIVDHVGFFITIAARYEVIPETNLEVEQEAMTSNQVVFSRVTGVICSFVPQLGDTSLVLQIMEQVVLDLLSRKLPLDNTCALIRMLLAVDSRCTQLSEKSIITLSDILLGYLIDVALLLPENDKEVRTMSTSISAWRYYLLPCFCLMDGSSTFLKYFLDKMGSATTESCDLPFVRDAEIRKDHLRRINAIVLVFLMICKDAKMRRVVSSCKAEIDTILQSVQQMQSSMVSNLGIEQHHKLQGAVESLKSLMREISTISS